MMKLTESIKNAIRLLEQIVSNYDVYYYINTSSISKSMYFYINLPNKETIGVRISDHELPDESKGHEYNKDITYFFDIQEDEVKNIKKEIIQLLNKYNIPKINKRPLWVEKWEEIFEELNNLWNSKEFDSFNSKKQFAIQELRGLFIVDFRFKKKTELKIYYKYSSFAEIVEKTLGYIPDFVDDIIIRLGV